MKLNQFIQKFDLTFERHGTGFFVWAQEMSKEAKWEIFNLTDYRVSSVACGQYFLIPV